LTIDDAESRPPDPNMPGGGLCQSVPLGFLGGCPSGIGNCNGNYWGNNQEVNFDWNLGTHIVDQMVLTLGYTGPMTFKSQDGMHTYLIRVGDVIKKDGQPFLVDWNGNPSPAITEMFNAAMATFGPAAGIPFDTPSTDCGADGNCLVFNSGGTTIMGFRPLVIYIQGNSGVPQPALSTPTQFYNFFSKFEPYGNLPQQMKLDAEGPVAQGKPNGARDPGMVCTQKIGLTFGDYKNNCIQVHGPAGAPDMIDTVNLNKIVNGLSHDQEHWTANVVGVNQNFTSEAVASSEEMVVLDSDKPQDGDVAQDFFFDLRAKGHPRNDYNSYCSAAMAAAMTNPCVKGSVIGYNASADKRDMHGSALLYVEWARLMLQDINKQLKASNPTLYANVAPKKLGDPDCVGYDSTGNPNFKLGCSGIEGLEIPTTLRGDFTKDASCVNAATCLDPGSNFDSNGNGYDRSLLKPGDKRAFFCVDVANQVDCGGGASTGESPFFTAAAWVQRRLGGGVLSHLPIQLQDRRYYFKWFGVAWVKYMKAYSDFATQANVDNWPCSTAVDPTCTNGGLGPTDVMNQYIDMESLFFDNSFTAVFDKFEYIDRENIGKGQVGTAAEKYNFIPWDFEYGIDMLGGNQRYDNFFRRMDREELALYRAMLTDETHTPGQENNVNITNLFGTSVLPGIWPTYQCAIGVAGVDPLTLGIKFKVTDTIVGHSVGFTATDPAGVVTDMHVTVTTGQTAADIATAIAALAPSNSAIAASGASVSGTVTAPGSKWNVSLVKGGTLTSRIAANPDYSCQGPVSVVAGGYPAVNVFPPLDSSQLASCSTAACDGVNPCNGGCANAGFCVQAKTWENGTETVCGTACDFINNPNTGCAKPNQTCVVSNAPSDAANAAGNNVTEACVDMLMDLNGPNAPTPHPMLWYYPSAWSRSPFAVGHSPITLHQADKHPTIGVAKITIPNFVDGPYTNSPQLISGMSCPTGWTADASGAICQAPLQTGTGNSAPSFTTLVPWLEVQPGVGFSFPIDGQHDQFVATGQLDFTGVLETYVVDIVPWTDSAKPSCAADNLCGAGYTCDPVGKACVANDDTQHILAIEGEDFLGEAFVCQDQLTGDILHVRQYDSALRIVNWLAAHPGGFDNFLGQIDAPAQTTCGIVIRYSPYNNYIDFITSKTNGVKLSVNQGAGLGRVVDIVLYDPSIPQTP
jgi:hypothetical protein